LANHPVISPPRLIEKIYQLIEKTCFAIQQKISCLKYE